MEAKHSNRASIDDGSEFFADEFEEEGVAFEGFFVFDGLVVTDGVERFDVVGGAADASEALFVAFEGEGGAEVDAGVGFGEVSAFFNEAFGGEEDFCFAGFEGVDAGVLHSSSHSAMHVRAGYIVLVGDLGQVFCGVNETAEH